MKKTSVVIALITVASQGVIYAVMHDVDVLVSSIVALLFILQGVIVFTIAHHYGFEMGLSSVKDGLKLETLIQKHMGMHYKKSTPSKTNNDLLTDNQPMSDIELDNLDLEITGI